MPAATTATPLPPRGAAGPGSAVPWPDRLVQRCAARRDGPECLVEPLRQVTLVADAHCKPPSTSSVLVRSAARAREAWLFTVPTEQPSVTAASVSVSPTQ